MTTAELTSAPTPQTTTILPVAANSQTIPPLQLEKEADHSLINTTALVATDTILLALLGSLTSLISHNDFHLFLGLPLLGMFHLAGMYPGFGLHSAERLRRRWLLTASYFSTLAVLMPSFYPLATGLAMMALMPLAEEFVRGGLRRLGCWGKAATLISTERQSEAVITTLRQNWQLGLHPTFGTDTNTAIISPGVLMKDTLSRYDSVFIMREGGMLHPFSQRGQWVGTVRVQNPHLLPWRLMKRSLDVIISATALILASPLIAVTAAFIYAVDPGPVFYSQLRRGLHGKAIRISKLRSMYTDSQQRLERLLATDQAAEREWNQRYKLANDPRILPVIGKFIRKYSIDELPQLWSVLKGELSVVGPRVFVDYDLATYTPEGLALRQSVVPGLTGLWQVSVRSDGNNEDKERYDTAYVRNWSFWLDLDILYRTIGVVLTGRGAV